MLERERGITEQDGRMDLLAGEQQVFGQFAAEQEFRTELRDGVMSAYKKMEPRVRDALKERADLGHLSVNVTMDLRTAQ